MTNDRERVERGSIPVPFAGCWLWLGAINTCGYGCITVKRRPVGAHRFSWSAFNGEIPAGLHVLHSCDVRSCVNPDHLFLGTHLTNMRDMKKKGRKPSNRGERNGRAKLSLDDVRVIRRSALGCLKLAHIYGVCESAIKNIRNGKAWAGIE